MVEALPESNIFVMPLSVAFLVTKILRWLGRDRLHMRVVILKSLLADVCNCCVSQNAPVMMDRKGMLVACRNRLITLLSLTFVENLVTAKKLYTETRVLVKVYIV